MTGLSYQPAYSDAVVTCTGPWGRLSVEYPTLSMHANTFACQGSRGVAGVSWVRESDLNSWYESTGGVSLRFRAVEDRIHQGFRCARRRNPSLTLRRGYC